MQDFGFGSTSWNTSTVHFRSVRGSMFTMWGNFIPAQALGPRRQAEGSYESRRRNSSLHLQSGAARVLLGPPAQSRTSGAWEATAPRSVDTESQIQTVCWVVYSEHALRTMTDRVQAELHAAACGDVDHNNTWHAIWVRPNSAHHNQLLTNHMGAVRVPETVPQSDQLLLQTVSFTNCSSQKQLTWEQEQAARLFSPNRSLLRSASAPPCRPEAPLLRSAPQTPEHLPGTNKLSGSDEPPERRPLQEPGINGKANLFIKHNSYTRQFKVLYSYIKSEEGK